LDLVGSGIVVLNQNGDDPAGDIIAVYDHAYPASRCEGVLAVEALPPCPVGAVALNTILRTIKAS
jgi:hypothetical protein